MPAFFPVHLEGRLYDIGITLSTKQFLAQHQDYRAGLLGWIQRLQHLGAGFYKFRKKHDDLSPYYEFSMTDVRNEVMSSPAARTILGTSDALVMPGIVLTSKK